MGKIRTRALGLEEVEQKQKKEQKRKAEKKTQKKTRTQGLKGGERMVEVAVSEEAMAKMEKAKKIITSAAPPSSRRLSRLKRPRGKKYQELKKKIDKNKKYGLETAISFLKKNKYTKFDESVEIHLNVDKTGLKGELTFPYATGKEIRVKIVDDKFIKDLESGIDPTKLADVFITHPSYMPRLAKFAKVLGPKGLMPNPKSGTISPNPEDLAKKFTLGVARWRTEAKAPLVHQMIGKISIEENNLVDNAKTFILSVGKSHIQAAFIKSTMSPSMMVDIEKI